MLSLLQEVRYALRMFRRSPGPALAAIVTLALGIGANTVIFTWANACLWKPLPLPDIENVSMVLERAPQGGNSVTPAAIGWDPVTPADYLDWRQQSTVFDKLAACKYAQLNISASRGEPESVVGSRASADYFAVLGVRPAFGRGFTPEEDQPGRDAVAVLGYGLWQRRFGADPGILGSTIVIEGRPRTVIGVMPKNFNFLLGVELWVPLALTPAQSHSRASHELFGLGRLKLGINRAQAAAEMRGIASRLERAHPDTNKGWGVRVMPLRDFVVPEPFQRFWFAILTAMLLALLVACVNVANLQLARLTPRMHEMGVRAAMGAGAARLTRQLLTESVLLSLSGAAAGLLIAAWASELLRGLLPAEMMKYITWDTSIDSRTLIFTASIAVLAGIVSGVAPAFHCAKLDLNPLLREGGRGASGSRSRQRLSGLLVVAQVACTMILLVVSAMCVRSFQQLGGDQDGIQPESLVFLRMNLNETTYALPQQRRAFADEALRRVRALPGVDSAAGMSIAPHTWQTAGSLFTIEGQAPVGSNEQRFCLIESVGPGYFRTMRIPLKDGRGITAQDGPETQPVAVISQGLARRYFPNENPLGQRLKLEVGKEWLTIVGVARDFHQHGLDPQPRPMIYLPYDQAPTQSFDVAIRVSGPNPAGLIPSARAVIRGMDARQPVYEARTLTKMIDVWELFGLRLAMHMMGALGLLALVLASVGLYGVLSYAVRQRTHEIGLRIALGAPLAAVQLAVVRRGLLLAGAGLSIGLAFSFGITQMIARVTQDVRMRDPSTLVGATITLLLVALVASYLPAWRAARVDPVETLRHE
jgi:putative ABC transport system permease protein